MPGMEAERGLLGALEWLPTTTKAEEGGGVNPPQGGMPKYATPKL